MRCGYFVYLVHVMLYGSPEKVLICICRDCECSFLANVNFCSVLLDARVCELAVISIG